jgi:hypothetical protein
MTHTHTQDTYLRAFPPGNGVDFALLAGISSKSAFIVAAGGVFPPMGRVLVARKIRGHTAYPPNILLFPDKKTKGGAYVSRFLLYHDPL